MNTKITQQILNYLQFRINVLSPKNNHTSFSFVRIENTNATNYFTNSKTRRYE